MGSGDGEDVLLYLMHFVEIGLAADPHDGLACTDSVGGGPLCPGAQVV